MEKLEKEMKSDMSGAKRDSMTEIFPGQLLTKGETKRKLVYSYASTGFTTMKVITLGFLLLDVSASILPCGDTHWYEALFTHCMKWHYCVSVLQYSLLNLEFSR